MLNVYTSARVDHLVMQTWIDAQAPELAVCTIAVAIDTGKCRRAFHLTDYVGYEVSLRLASCACRPSAIANTHG